MKEGVAENAVIPVRKSVERRREMNLVDTKNSLLMKKKENTGSYYKYIPKNH
jgi:hypothetical protein